MTDARDELAGLIRKAGWDAQDSPDYEKCGFDSDLFIADAILAAGWRAPELLMAAGWKSPGEQLLSRPYDPTEPMRQTIATVLLNESSHRDEYYGGDLPPAWWEYTIDWEQEQRNPSDWDG